MLKNKIFNIVVMLFLLASPLFYGGAQALAGPAQSTASGQGVQNWSPYPNDEIGGTNSDTGQQRTTTQAMREAAAYQNKQSAIRTNLNFAGIEKNSSLVSPMSADSITPLATMNPLGTPDYFGIANYANSPWPQVSTTGALVAGTGIRKFVNTLPGLCGVASANGTGTNNLGQCMPIAVPDTTTFPGTDYYEIALVQYNLQMHSDLPPTLIRGYVQISTAAVPGAHVALSNAASPNGLGGGAIKDKSGAQVYGVTAPQYLGPVILAQGCDIAAANGSTCTYRPVRVKFTNYLPTGAGGNLELPMDSTYMGAGMGPGGSIYSFNVTNGGSGYTSVPTVTLSAPPAATPANIQATGVAAINNGKVVSILVTNGGTGYTTAPTVTFNNTGTGGTGAAATSVLAGQPGEMYKENRATLHLHGGNTPWISDGTPHQWTVPVGEVTSYQKGDSVGYVPDMWFNANGQLLSTCQGQTTCATTGASNNPGNGSLTFYWTNEQSGRMMFFHDHSYGITRLNVYAGEAAGYLLVDQNEETALKALGVPGTLVTGSQDLAHLVVMVLQDKSYVPDSGVTGGQLAATDPTWSVANWGGKGALWLPHVWTPNQNPADITGANGFGRWDYGPWFWPAQNPATYVAGAQPYACSSVFYNATNPGPAFPPLMCPGIPNPTGVMEGFMDTPVVNGTVYPTMTVDPTAYRFQFLNAANDRSWNMQLYVAEPLSIGVVSGGSGYTAAPAVTITPAAGDTTGGGASATAVMSSGAVGSITVTGVGHGYTTPPLVTITGDGTGAAATAVVAAATGTISAINVTAIGSGYTFANVTIAAPCTGTGCQTATAVANIIPAGSVMSIKVTNPGAGWTLPPVVTIAAPTAGITATAVAAINSEVAMLPAVPPGSVGSTLAACSQINPTGGGMQVTALFDATGQPLNGTGLPANCWPAQWPTDGRDGGVPDPTKAGPPIIVLGEEGGVLPQLAVIPSTPMGFEYNRRSITVLNTYTHGLYLGPAERSDFMVDFSQFAGKTLIFYNDAPAPNPAFDPRSDYYTGDPDNTATGGAPSTLPGYGPNTRTFMQIKVNAGVGGGTGAGAGVSSIAVTNGGAGYTTPVTTLGAPGAGGTQATGTASGAVTGLALTAAGSGYSNPVVTFAGGGGSGAAASMSSGVVNSLLLTNTGAGYTAAPTVGFTGTGTLAAAKATISVNGIAIGAAGAGYSSAPTIAIADTAVPATATTLASAKATVSVAGVTISNGGAGYSSAPTVTISDAAVPPTASTLATAKSTISVNGFAALVGGAGYITAPTVTISDPTVPATIVTPAAATSTLKVSALTITAAGAGYSAAPTLTMTGAATAKATVSVTGVTLVAGGSGYTAPTVTIADSLGGTGTGATASATVVGGVITAINLLTPGAGYTAPVVTIADTTGTLASATTTGVVDTVTLLTPGAGYATMPTVTVSGTGGAVITATGAVDNIIFLPNGAGYTAPALALSAPPAGGTQATATATGVVDSIIAFTAGAHYTTPSVAFTGGGFTTVATATTTGVVDSVSLIVPGAHYTTPTLTLSGGGTPTTAATITFSGVVDSLTLTSGGTGYSAAPTVNFTGGGTPTTVAAANATIASTGILLTAGGNGYTSAPTVTIADTAPGTGSGATAVATISINAVAVTNPGAGYLTAPAVTIADTAPGVGTGAAATANLTASASFSLTALTAGLPGVFAATQDKVIIPEAVYPAANGGGVNTYSRIQDTSLTTYVGGAMGTITLTSGGAGYTATPAVTITGGGGTGATATAALSPTTITSLILTNGGSGYTSAPTVAFAGGGGTGAAATAALAPSSVASATITNQGNGYTSVPTVTFSAPQTAGTTAAGTAVVTNRRVTAITITQKGTGYTAAPTITITGGGGTGARAVATLSPAAVGSLTLTNPGSGFTSAPTVSFAGGGGSGAAATANLVPVPVASITVTNGGTGYTGAPTIAIAPPQTTGTTATAVATAPVQQMLPKTIQELFTLDYGRMNATLGVELPFTNFLTQTTIPYGYVDPPTELFQDGDVQVWKITHNGVDTHFIHFHLFTVQLINRVGWDGMIKAPDPVEVGFKDTVRMNPLEDVIVALRPMKQVLPWQLPLSVRPMDVTESIGNSLPNEFTNVGVDNNPATVNNDLVNFGYEYVWHCHILSHEEIDMMRAMVFVVPPVAPSNLAFTQVTTSRAVKLTWKDNALYETGFTIMRSITPPTSPSWVIAGTAPAMPGTGGTASFVDTTVAQRTTYWYEVIANNLAGYTQTYAAPAVGYPTLDAPSLPSNNVQVTTNNSGTVTPFSANEYAPYVFASSFQAGTGDWSGVVGSVQALKAAEMGPDGKHLGMAADLSAAQGSFVVDKSPAGIGTYDAAFEFNPNGAVSGSDPLDIFVGLDQNGLPAFGIQYQRIMVEAEPVYQVRSWVQLNGDQLFSSWVDVGNYPTRLELAWSSAASGGLSLYADGFLAQTLTGNTSGRQLVDSLLGPSGGLSGASGTLYFDEFTSSTLLGVGFSIYVPVIKH